MVRVVMVCISVVGCGRVGFDREASALDASPDATLARDAATEDGSAHDASADDGGAIDASDGGAFDAASRDAAVAGPCDDEPGVIFCDSFDGAFRPEWFEDATDGTLAVVPDPMGSDNDVLRVALDHDGRARLLYFLAAPYTEGGELHIRARVLLEDSGTPLVEPLALFKLNGADFVQLRVHPGDSFGITGPTATEIESAPAEFPRGRWVCATVRILLAFADGLIDATIDGSFLQLEPVNTRFAGGYTDVALGLTGQGPNVVYFDDFYFGTNAGPCP
jgi:hypothetical protein